MTRRTTGAVVALLMLLTGFVLAGVAPAYAHEERPASFPDGTGHRPAYLGLDNPRHRVVCTPRQRASGRGDGRGRAEAAQPASC